MKRFRLIDEVSIYYHDRNKKVIHFVAYWLVFNRSINDAAPISQPPGLVPFAGKNLVTGPKMFDFLGVLKQDQ